MSSQETRELVKIRHDLRTVLVTGGGDVRHLLSRLWELAEADPAQREAIQAEHARWRVRFELLESIDQILRAA